MTKLIFKNIDEMQQHVVIAASTDFNVLKPTIRTAQKTYLFDLFGKTFVSELIDKLESSDGPSDLEQECIDLMRYVVAQMTMYSAVDVLNIEIIAGGFTVNSTEGKVVASANRVLLFKEQLYKNAQDGINTVFDYLEDNADDFTAWKDGDARKAFKKFIVNNPKKFSDGLLGVKVGYFLFNQMLAAMAVIERRYFIKILGENLFNHIKTKLEASESLGDYAPILPYMQRAIAPIVFAETFGNLAIELDGTGAYISSLKNANEPQQRGPLPNDLESRIDYRHRRHAEKAFEELANHLLTNADDYQLYNESTAFSDRTGTAPILPDEGTAAFYAM